VLRAIARRCVREARVPLSPFIARIAAVGFFLVGTSIAANVLYLQGNDDRGAKLGRYVAAVLPKPRVLSDVEKLERLALEASGGRAAPEPQPDRSVTETAHHRDTAFQTERIGSFAPSSGKIPLIALPGADPGEARRATIRGVQSELSRRGYEPGAANGAPSLVTRAAVMAYEHDQGLPLTADPSPEVLAHLRHGTSAPGAAIGLDASSPRTTGQAENVIRSVQQWLAQLGYLASAADGVISDETIRAIREFEMDAGLVPGGRISGPLVARLTRQLAASGTR